MTTHAEGLGTVITFYSYKGGTGRSMALANTAVLLADQGKKKVLAIDWDLDAPGLHRYFRKHLVKALGSTGDRELNARPGLLDLIHEIRRALKAVGGEDIAGTVEQLAAIQIGNYIIESDIRGVTLLKAGTFNDKYERDVTSFGWQQMFSGHPDSFRLFARRLAADYDYVLIDSRTGHSDISGICTTLMPDKLVLVFTPNRQNYEGIAQKAENAMEYRKRSSDLRPLIMLPLPTRIEIGEPELRQAWRYGDEVRGLLGYQKLFEGLLERSYGIERCELESYFDEIQIQQIPRYAYGEEIAALDEPSSDVFSMRRSFERFSRILSDEILPWEMSSSSAEPSRSGLAATQLASRDFFGSVDSIHSLAETMVTAGDSLMLRNVTRAARARILTTWRARISVLDETRADAQVADSKIYELCLPFVRNFDEDVWGVEQAGLEFVDGEFPAGILSLMKLVEDWISLTAERGRLRPVYGTPELLALRVMSNWGARAVENMSFSLLSVILTEPLETTEFNQVSVKPFSERADLMHPPAFLERADLAVQYVRTESWRSPGVMRMFATESEYARGLAGFLFLWSLLSEADPGQQYPLYPAFKMVDPSGQGVFALYSRLSRSSDAQVSLANMFGETLSEFKEKWPARIKRLNEARLGRERDFFSDWKDLPESL